MIGLLLLIIVAAIFGYIVYVVALKIGKDQTIASLIGLVVFLLILFGGWGRVGVLGR
jgi:heme/copper-type cytochrome/quinol oxidase subunit 1